MVQTFFQWIVVLFLVILWLAMVKRDFNGASVHDKPQGFEGFILSCLVIAIVALVFYGAGAFSRLFGG